MKTKLLMGWEDWEWYDRSYFERIYAYLRSLLAEDFDIRFFGRGAPDVDCRLAETPFPDIISRLGGFEPELCIVLSAGYSFLPLGIEDAPFPVALVTQEWNLTTGTFLQAIKRVDHVLAPSIKQANTLRRLGIEVTPFVYPDNGQWGAYFQDVEPQPKRWDLSYVGNLNFPVTLERARLLWRVANLPERFKVLITTTQNGSDFAELKAINAQSKICLNKGFPLKGEFSGRIFHIMSCGSFCLTDRLPDTEEVMQDGFHVGMYEDSQLEEKIAYYVDNDAEREAIARRGQERIQELDFRWVLKQIFGRLKQRGDLSSLRRDRPFRAQSEFEKLMDLGTEAFYAGMTPLGLERARTYFERAIALEPSSAEAHSNLGMVFRGIGDRSNGADRAQWYGQAEASFATALRLDASYLMARFNLAELYYVGGRKDDFFAQLHRFRAELERLSSFERPRPLGLYNAASFTLFKLRFEVLRHRHFGEPYAGFVRDAYRMMRWQLHQWAGEACLADGNPHAARPYLDQALQDAPEEAFETHFALAAAAWQESDTQRAVTHLMRTLESHPFHHEAAALLGRCYQVLGRYEELAEHGSRYGLAFSRVNLLAPAAAEHHLSAARALEALGRVEKARQSYEKAIAINPQHAEARDGLTRIARQAASTTQPPREARTLSPSQRVSEIRVVPVDWSKSWLNRELPVHAPPHAGGMIEVNGVYGYMMPGDLSLLTRLARMLPAGGTYVEIGSFMGLSSIVTATAMLAERNFDAKLYCIDRWDDALLHRMSLELPTMPLFKERKLFHIFCENIQNAQVTPLICPLKRASVEAAALFSPESVDVLFLDGDPSYEGCYGDLTAWFDKLKPGALVLGHECAPGSGVYQAVSQFTAERGLNFRLHEPPAANFVFELFGGSLGRLTGQESQLGALKPVG